ncbi:hypothetical protein H5410_036203 [Solanum commersonii]|uniref:Uncharacterized protein n=1 Tax=Solanum commersonii TaxID=4109 RepID=A0A9J5Y2X4_SOLCO|nr:hypothetical protein H5410_036203 [Solanum commersonii]
MMEWLACTLKEVSKSHGNTVRRWKCQDHFTELQARNYNKFGRYISIIKVQDKKRDVIIIPEWSLNSGWMNIATKISVFINAKAQPTDAISTTQNESLAKSVVRSLLEEIPGITLSEIRRWVTSPWRHNHGINIFDLGGIKFSWNSPIERLLIT